MAKATYKDAGVDLELYADAMARLPRLLRRTHTPRVLPLEGGFAGLFQLDFASRLFARNYRDPVLVACTDGVGTKLKVAMAAGIHNTVGIDLVAMSVNDALCCGAEPLFFLDYVAMPKDDPALLEQLVEGISAGCVESDCALLGGETAILPDLYAPGDYDLAGFCVGVVSRKQVIDGKAIAAGDVVLGLASTGLHSNGYSLARKIAFEIAGLKTDSHIEELGMTVGRECSRPRGSTPNRSGRCWLITASRRWFMGLHTSPEEGCTKTSPGSCRRECESPSIAAVGRSRPSSPGCRSWAKWNKRRWIGYSIWVWAWSWSSARTLPRASAASCATRAWRVG